MNPIALNQKQKKAAENLKEGAILAAYRDDNSIRMETKNGENPYVWRENNWRAMK